MIAILMFLLVSGLWIASSIYKAGSAVVERSGELVHNNVPRLTGAYAQHSLEARRVAAKHYVRLRHAVQDRRSS